MELHLKRDTLTDTSTIGKLFINGAYECDTLEDKVRDVKIPNITAIPKGRYEVSLTFSNRFQQLMPEILHVPNYIGIRIHWGNYSKDTDGCILLGTRNSVHDFVGNSKIAYAKFMAKIVAAAHTEKIFIIID